MKGCIVRDGRGHYWRVYSAFYVPWVGIRINMERPRATLCTTLSRFIREGGSIVRRPPCVARDNAERQGSLFA